MKSWPAKRHETNQLLKRTNRNGIADLFDACIGPSTRGGGIAMTVLEATITLIDAAKQLPEDKVLQRAIKRMEKRVRLLQVRAMKARKRNRIKAWWDAFQILGGGATTLPTGKLVPVIVCKSCKIQLTFTEFCRNGEFNGHGKCTSLFCPKCETFLIGKPPEDEIDWGNLDDPKHPLNVKQLAKS